MDYDAERTKLARTCLVLHENGFSLDQIVMLLFPVETPIAWGWCRKLVSLLVAEALGV